MSNIAFDFDDTLKYANGQPSNFVDVMRSHLNQGDNVYIVTSRLNNKDNFDEIRQFLSDQKILIPPSRIFLTDGKDKGEFINLNPILHIDELYDDDEHERNVAEQFGIKAHDAWDDDAQAAWDQEHEMDEGRKKNKSFKTFIRPIALDEDE